MSNKNQELLLWAIENLTEEDWPEEWTHLRSDPSEVPKILTSGDADKWYSEVGFWWAWRPIFKPINSQHKTSTPQVITREEWLEIIKGKTMKNELFGKKYINLTPGAHKMLQEAVLKAGGKWVSGRTMVNTVYIYEKELYVDHCGTMTRYAGRDFPEATVEIVNTIKVVPVETEEDKRKKSLEEKIQEHQRTLDELKKELEQISSKSEV